MSPQQTQKVRLSLRKAHHLGGRRAGRGAGGVFLVPRRLWQGGDGQEADPWVTRVLGACRAFRVAEGEL